MTERRCPTTAQVQAMIAAAGGEAYKVGDLVLNIDGVNPATKYGYGTWVQIAEGQFLVGQKSSDADFDTAEETGGAKTHSHTSHSTEDQRNGTGVIAVNNGSHNTVSHLPPYFVAYIWRRDA